MLISSTEYIGNGWHAEFLYHMQVFPNVFMCVCGGGGGDPDVSIFLENQGALKGSVNDCLETAMEKGNY